MSTFHAGKLSKLTVDTKQTNTCLSVVSFNSTTPQAQSYY